MRTVLGYKVYSMHEYQKADIKDGEIFLVYTKDFVMPDEYSMKVFVNGKEHNINASQEQLDANNLTPTDFVQIASDELINKIAL